MRVELGKPPPMTLEKRLQLDLWTGLCGHLRGSGTRFSLRKPQPRPYHDFTLGKTGYWLRATAAALSGPEQVFDHEIGGDFLVDPGPPRKWLFAQAFRHDALQKQLGADLTWHISEADQQWRVSCTIKADLANRALWPRYFDWFAVQLECFREVFQPLLRDAPAASSPKW